MFDQIRGNIERKTVQRLADGLDEVILGNLGRKDLAKWLLQPFVAVMGSLSTFNTRFIELKDDIGSALSRRQQ